MQVSQTISDPTVALAPGIRMAPVAHGSLACADEVRRAVAERHPDCIAIEFPRPLAEPFRELVGSLPEIRVLAWKRRGAPALMFAADPCDPLVEAARLAGEYRIPLEFVDTWRAGHAGRWQRLPDEWAATRIGLSAWAEATAEGMPADDAGGNLRVVAARLRALSRVGKDILFVGAVSHLVPLRALLAGRERRLPSCRWNELVPNFQSAPLTENQLPLVLREMPRLAWLFENFRAGHGPETRFPILGALRQILRMASAQYEEEYDEPISMTEWRALFQFGRNLAIVRGHLRPRLYEMVQAAKGCVDDDFGAIVLETLSHYPPNARPGEEQEHDGQHTSLNLHTEFSDGVERPIHAYPYPPLGEIFFEFHRRPPATPEEKLKWRAGFGRNLMLGAGICSWPPEDIFIENFFRTIRTRAQQEIGANHSTSEPFTSSVLDGLDIRETMRHLHERKIYVRRERIPPGKVGPVVLIWRDVHLAASNLWRTSLYAENSNESDIAFYSTPLGREMVGPGISRIEYSGILSVYPARGIADVWDFPPLYGWETHGRLLVAAAIMMSEERYIAVVSAKPPHPELRELARRHSRALVYLPLAMFSRALLKRARKCHILDSKQARTWASDYIPRV